MEETTTAAATESFDLSNFSLDDVKGVLDKIIEIYRTIIDALKSVIKPILKSGIDSIIGSSEE